MSVTELGGLELLLVRQQQAGVNELGGLELQQQQSVNQQQQSVNQ